MNDKGPRDYEDLIVYFNGEHIPWEDAKIHVFSPLAKYGAGVFEGIRAYWSEKRQCMVIFRLEDHLKRLEYSQKVMRFDRIIPAEEISRPLIELMRRNDFKEHVQIRPTVYVDGDGEVAAQGPVDTSIVAVRRDKKIYNETGLKVQVSSWQRVADVAMPARVKANANYQNSRLAATQARADGYDTALLLNAKGHVSEGPGMCLFMVRDGVLITPSISSNILESITRDTIIQIARDELGMETVERDVDRSELYAAEEAFFCGTAWEVAPITEIDRLPVGNGFIGPITKKITSAYFDIVTGESEDSRGWLTTV